MVYVSFRAKQEISSQRFFIAFGASKWQVILGCLRILRKYYFCSSGLYPNFSCIVVAYSRKLVIQCSSYATKATIVYIIDKTA